MKLYIDHYSNVHKWKVMAFAVKEWILRENVTKIIEDLKFLTRKGIMIILFHNIPPNLWNTRFLQENIIAKLPNNSKIERIHSENNLYEQILSCKLNVDKLIILERQPLIWIDWKKVNTITTKKLKVEIEEWNIGCLWIWNINFNDSLLSICKAIEKWNINRVHVLPWWKENAIKHELFSLEWVWTLIWNDFWSPLVDKASIWTENIIQWILSSNKKNKYLKPRSKEYILENIENFRIAYIDGIPVWCVEIIRIDENTIELWALAVVHSFLSLKIWKALIDFVESYALEKHLSIISLTNSPKLQWIYDRIWYIKGDKSMYQERRSKSPWVQLYYIKYESLFKKIMSNQK